MEPLAEVSATLIEAEAPARRRRFAKASAAAPPAASQAPPWAAPRVSPDDLLYFYDTNVWHRRCVLLKALCVGGLGCRVAGEEGAAYPAVEALVRRPNGNRAEALEDVLFRALVDFYATGNGYLEVVRGARGLPAEIYHLPARDVRRAADLTGYWQIKAGRRVSFANYGADDGRSELLHFALYDPCCDYYGLPDWYAALGVMGLDRTVLEFNTRLFANSLMAQMAVVVEGGRLSAAGREALRAFLHERATGVGNAGRLLLLEEDREQAKVRFEKLSLEVKDLLIVEAQRHFRDVVLGAHGVPARVLGIAAPGHLGGAGEVEGQLQTFAETVLRPGRRMAERLLSALADDVAPGARLTLAALDITDQRVDAAFFSAMLQHGVLTPEEVRRALGDTLRAAP